MTRDERAAISILNAYKEGYESAIEDYKQEPCDDAISRDAVDELSKELVHTTRDKADFLCNFWEGLQKLPPVTQKSGKWIDHSDEGYVECPFCGHATTCEDNIDELHYCFYCGARMESEE